MNRRIIPFQGWRLTLYQAVIFFSFLVLVLGLYNLQFTEHEEWALLAQENRLQLLPLPASRGVVYDRNGEQLALNVPAFNITIIPAAIPGDDEAALAVYNRLSAMIDVPATRAAADAAGRFFERSIQGMVDEGAGIEPYRAVVIAQDIPRETAMRILEDIQLLPGVSVDVASVREYPSGETTAQIIGYLGPIGEDEAQDLIEQGYNPAYDRIGYTGIEFFLDGELSGQRGSRLREVDVAGLPIRVIQQEDPISGRNVTLTIDLELQEAATEALTRRINIVNADAGRVVTQSGVVIAMDPQTGEVLAMVSWPTYDNQRFARSIDGEYYFQQLDDPLRPLVNNAMQSLYPPGSVWKLLTAVGVIEEDVIDPDQQLFCGGNLVLPNRYAPNDPAASQNFVCWLRTGHQELAMREAISESCDVYFYQVGGGNPDISEVTLRPNGLDIDDLFRYATAFGIGSELGVELPSETAGRMPDRDWKRRTHGENWSTGDTYNAAFGQGYVTVTPLQLIAATAAIASDGIVYQPTVVHSFLDGEGNVIEPFEPHINRTLQLPEPGSLATLFLLEDMIVQGEESLACTCEENSEFYDEAACDPDNYINTIDFEGRPVDYTVNVPRNYVFNGSVCDRNRFDPAYVPPFASLETIQIVQEGMLETVMTGTGSNAALPYTVVAGKTGTAEYCDDIARPLGLCVPGGWPSHAWFTAYAPYENPEIIVIGFVYNGGEGSLVALPVVRDTMEAYFQLQESRGGS